MTDDSTVAPAAGPSPAAPAAPPVPVTTAAAHGSPGSARPWIAGFFVVGALAVASLVATWNTRERLRTLEEQLVRRQQTSADEATEARLLAKQAIDAVREAQGKIGVLDERVAESALQRSQVEELMQSLSRSRDENVLSDIETALRVAMQQAALTGSTEPIAAVLRQSEERLARYDNPRLERARRAVARDLDRVRNASVVDVPSLTIRLDEAVRMIDELPLVTTPERVAALRTAGVAASAAQAASAASTAMAGGSRHARLAAASAPASAESEPEWLGSLRAAWEHFSTPFFGELRQAVRVTSIEHPEAMLITPEQSFFLRENVKLRLLNARLSLLSRQYDLAQADLQQAQAALNRYFDRSSRRVVAVSDLLRQVSAQARQVTFPRPDDTLAALAAAAAGR